MAFKKDTFQNRSGSHDAAEKKYDAFQTEPPTLPATSTRATNVHHIGYGKARGGVSR